TSSSLGILKVEARHQPRHRYRQRDHQDQENDPAFPACFAQRTRPAPAPFFVASVYRAMTARRRAGSRADWPDPITPPVAAALFPAPDAARLRSFAATSA